MLRIRDVYTGFQIQIFPSRIQGQKDPGSGSSWKILTQKIVSKLSEIWSRGSGFFMPDPGVKKAPDPGSKSATLLIAYRKTRFYPHFLIFSNLEKNVIVDSFILLYEQ